MAQGSGDGGALGDARRAHVVVFSVDGDPNFETYLALLPAFGVPRVIVCDGSVYRFGAGKRQIFEQVLRAGIRDSAREQTVGEATAAGSAAFADLRDLGERCGIFTLANSWDKSAESFEVHLKAKAPGRLAEASRSRGPQQPRQGSYVAAATECPDRVDAL